MYCSSEAFSIAFDSELQTHGSLLSEAFSFLILYPPSILHDKSRLLTLLGKMADLFKFQMKISRKIMFILVMR